MNFYVPRRNLCVKLMRVAIYILLQEEISQSNLIKRFDVYKVHPLG